MLHLPHLHGLATAFPGPEQVREEAKKGKSRNPEPSGMLGKQCPHTNPRPVSLWGTALLALSGLLPSLQKLFPLSLE